MFTMTGWEARYIEKIDRAEGTKSFRFERPKDFDYNPGQYFFITIPKEEGDEGILMHHFSFSSSPSESEFIEFTTRIRDTEFKQRIDGLPLGTAVKITEVHGEFTINESMKRVAFICGGIGITAALSNIIWAAAKKIDIDIILLYANRNQSGIAFLQELEELSGPRLKVIHILSKPDEGWMGSTGNIDADFVRAQVLDRLERHFFISGPPTMVEAVQKVLIDDVGASEELLKTENFLGY